MLAPYTCCNVVIQVPLLGGALCACTWHFFYNAESLEVSLCSLFHCERQGAFYNPLLNSVETFPTTIYFFLLNTH